MSQDERSIIQDHVFLCGDCAMEHSHREFRTEAYADWWGDTRPPETMKDRLIRKEEVTEALHGCARCWSEGHNVMASYAVELMIDGDA